MEGLESGGQATPTEHQRPITEEGTPEEAGNTIEIPREFLQGKQFKPGDELVLKVVTSDEDGLEVAYAPAKAEEAEPEPQDANSEIDSINDGD